MVRTVKDKDGPGGRDPKPRTKFRLRGGKHRWFVRAWDYAGNKRTSRAFAGSKARKSSVLYVGKRGPHAKRQRAKVRQRARAEAKAKAKAGR